LTPTLTPTQIEKPFWSSISVGFANAGHSLKLAEEKEGEAAVMN
jgi:hypothetical protein